MSTYALTLESRNAPVFFKGRLKRDEMARFISNRIRKNITFRADKEPVSIDSNWTLSEVHSSLDLNRIERAFLTAPLPMTLVATGTVPPLA